VQKGEKQSHIRSDHKPCFALGESWAGAMKGSSRPAAAWRWRGWGKAAGRREERRRQSGEGRGGEGTLVAVGRQGTDSVMADEAARRRHASGAPGTARGRGAPNNCPPLTARRAAQSRPCRARAGVVRPPSRFHRIQVVSVTAPAARPPRHHTPHAHFRDSATHFTATPRRKISLPSLQPPSG
jgi:hypothetical protein